MSENKDFKGKRVYPGIAELEVSETQTGDYWKDTSAGTWYGRCPSGELANLAGHTITEHLDGTITVTPSILVQGEKTWHGYLNHGVWQEIEA